MNDIVTHCISHIVRCDEFSRHMWAAPSRPRACLRAYVCARCASADNAATQARFRLAWKRASSGASARAGVRLRGSKRAASCIDASMRVRAAAAARVGRRARSERGCHADEPAHPQVQEQDRLVGFTAGGPADHVHLQSRLVPRRRHRHLLQRRRQRQRAAERRRAGEKGAATIVLLVCEPPPGSKVATEMSVSCAVASLVATILAGDLCDDGKWSWPGFLFSVISLLPLLSLCLHSPLAYPPQPLSIVLAGGGRGSWKDSATWIFDSPMSSVLRVLHVSPPISSLVELYLVVCTLSSSFSMIASRSPGIKLFSVKRCLRKKEVHFINFAPPACAGPPRLLPIRHATHPSCR
eukprot:1998292-Pleurochrysis_carterae.AAC.1